MAEEQYILKIEISKAFRVCGALDKAFLRPGSVHALMVKTAPASRP